MKNIRVRIKSAIILFSIIIPFFFITYFAKLPGKIIGLSFFAVLAAWATYEVLSHSVLKRWENILITLLTTLIWAMPLDWYNANDSNNIFINKSATGFDINELLIQLKHAVFFGNDTLTSFRTLQILIISTVISLIYLINLFTIKEAKYKAKKIAVSFFVALFATIFIPLAFKTLFIYNWASLYYVFAIAIIPIVTDTMAYVGGSLLGKKIIKVGMAPRISPKKSWEGTFIGFLFGALFVFIVMYLGKMTNNKTFTIFTNWKQLVVGIFVLPIISILGDLLFSLIKRLYDIKDFSNLIPGHGGFMDRFDSLTCVIMATSAILLIN
ncbi:phosphatidate cytidylyltransferase [Mycoplasma enhydrae]|uniref:phosphatidate cytidylyltransferase n=1 Tax=Mycoplasma enhydrae TaxID=2499220 RepID=UPI00197C3AD4|nr:phosphatidate cytidylyltransferase [Mycoplasma enhydrae]MBN4089617.1 phosphatidate cytidylyltransferase [Mycoplasma enhydrae]MCV3733789.1 phosphatidate cytidylyltransferase [Mycoplasma enhydrae]MCV3753744.1 phosphatidate cytidylyltransferase [Mycoplasma enhydrae]